MNIGEKIKELRLQRNLTLEELASAAGTTKQTIHKYENGIISNIPASKIKAMADKLHTTPACLMGWDEELANSTEIDFARKKITKLLKDSNLDEFTLVEKLKKVGIVISFASLHQWLYSNFTYFTKIDDFKKIAKAMGIAVEELLGRQLPQSANEGINSLEAIFPDGITPDAHRLMKNYSQLNETGQKKVLDFSDDLISSNNYSVIGRETGYRIAAYGATGTEEDYQPPIEEITT